jgi:hypothetical protein
MLVSEVFTLLTNIVACNLTPTIAIITPLKFPGETSITSRVIEIHCKSPFDKIRNERVLSKSNGRKKKYLPSWPYGRR